MSQATILLHPPKDVGEPQPAETRSGWRLQRLALLFAITGFAILWFAPTFVARTSLRHRIISVVLPAYPAKGTIGNASLSWFAPARLGDVRLFDEAGEELLHIQEVNSSKPLIRLVLDSQSELGHYMITEPHLTVRFRTDGSNLEDVLKPLLEEPSSSAGLSCEIENASAKWVAPSGVTVPGGLENVQVTFSQQQGASQPSRLEISGNLSDGEHAGAISLLLRNSATAPGTPEYTFRASELPLAAAQTLLDRIANIGEASGTVNADLLFSLSTTTSSDWWADGKVDVNRLRLNLSDGVGRTALVAEQASLAGRVSSSAHSLQLEKLQFASDIGTISANATLSPEILQSRPWSEQLAILMSQDVTSQGELNLSQLTPLLPPQAQLHRPIQAGKLAFECRTLPGPHGNQAEVRLRVNDIVAGTGEQRIAWKEPLAANLMLMEGVAGLSVEQLQVASDFLSLSGSASSRQGDIQFEADLDRLATHLSQLFEIEAGALAGKASGRLSLRQSVTGDTVQAQLDTVLQEFQMRFTGRNWTERKLTIVCESEFELAEASIDRINSASLAVESVEGDELTAILREPSKLSYDVPWSADVKITGEIERWLARLRGALILPPGEWEARGSLDGSGVITLGPHETGATELNAQVDRFQLQLADRAFEEPYLRLRGDLVWNHANNRCVITTGRFESETAIAEMSDIDIPLLADGPASGTVRFRGGIGRIARYLLPARPPFWVSGIVAGDLSLASQEATTTARGQFTFEKPTVSLPVVLPDRNVAWQPVWSDSKADFAIDARYRHDIGTVDLNSAQLGVSGATLDASGALSQLSTVAVTDLNGEVAYDLETLLPRLLGSLPAGLRLRGKRADGYSVRGPLISPLGIDPALRANTRLGWESANAWGLQIGPSELPLELDRTILRLGPLDVPVAGGRIRTSATVPLNAGLTLTFEQGRVAENISITPEICRQWLRYAMPALAETADLAGTASLDLQACTIPLRDPVQTRAVGSLAIGKLEATPGPFARSILETVQQVQRIAGNDPTQGSDLRLYSPPQTVLCRIDQRRVFHDRFTVQLGDQDGPLIATSGSVGFDESLDLVVEIPLDAKWFRDERVAKALGGQLLRIPVGGTLSSPAPDQRAFQDLARRAATGAVQNAVDQQIQKQIRDPLKKLFDRSQ